MADSLSRIAKKYRTEFTKALTAFQEKTFQNPADGNRFSENHGAGNGEDRVDTYERFIRYESLLIELAELDRYKYDRMHKGTPFFFLGWIGLDLRKYESAMFYLDMAVAKD